MIRRLKLKLLAFFRKAKINNQNLAKFMYHSIIIKESLEKPEVLNDFKIIRTKLSSGEKWHLHIVEIPELSEDIISRIQGAMVSNEPYYFHIYDEGKSLVVVFKDKVFDINPADKVTWKEAIAYGAQKLNIPPEQLDFYPSKISEEDDWYNRD